MSTGARPDLLAAVYRSLRPDILSPMPFAGPAGRQVVRSFGLSVVSVVSVVFLLIPLIMTRDYMGDKKPLTPLIALTATGALLMVGSDGVDGRDSARRGPRWLMAA